MRSFFISLKAFGAPQISDHDLAPVVAASSFSIRPLRAAVSATASTWRPIITQTRQVNLVFFITFLSYGRGRPVSPKITQSQHLSHCTHCSSSVSLVAGLESFFNPLLDAINLIPLTAADGITIGCRLRCYRLNWAFRNLLLYFCNGLLNLC